MDKQIPLFDVAAPPVAGPAPAPAAVKQDIHQPASAWFRAGATTPVLHAQRVLRGIHPNGRALAPWPGARCGNCRNAVRTEEHSSTFWKCAAFVSEWTAGPASDLRLKWRACDRWVPGPNGRVGHFYRTPPPDGAERLHHRDPHRWVVRGDRIRGLVPAWWPVPGVHLPEVALTLLRITNSQALVAVPEADGALMRLNERVMTACIQVEELAPTHDHTRVALAMLVEVVGEKRLEVYPAARLLLAAVEAGVAQTRRALGPTWPEKE